jgi:predicted Zn-dependent protease
MRQRFQYLLTFLLLNCAGCRTDEEAAEIVGQTADQERLQGITLRRDAAGLAQAGRDLLRRSEFVSALPYLLRAVDLDPGNPEYSVVLASTLVFLGEIRHARPMLERLEKDRDKYETNLKLVVLCESAYVSVLSGQHEHATKLVEEAVICSPNSAYVQHTAAHVYGLMRQYQLAREHAVEAVNLVDAPRHRVTLARMTLELSGRSEAIRALNKGTGRQGERCQSGNPMLDLLLNENLSEEARETLKEMMDEFVLLEVRR